MEIKVLKVVNGDYTENNSATDSIRMLSLLTATKELTDGKLANLIDGAEANDEHIHDDRYFRENEHVSASAGVADAGKPLVLDAAGLLSQSLLNLSGLESQIDHNALSNLTVGDPHSQYILVDGTRAFTGDQSLGTNKLTEVVDPTAPQDAATKAYVDAIATGLRPKGNVAAASTANVDVTSPPATLDGYTLVSGDRILLKDQSDQTENGVYIFNGGGSALTRSTDFDNDPLAEVVNGAFIPAVLNGTVNMGSPFFIASVGSDVNGLHQIGTDPIVWDEFTSPTQLQAGNGVEIVGNTVNADLLLSGGLKFESGELAVAPTDFAGEGVVDDGSDNIAVDFATTTTPGDLDGTNAGKVLRASDLFGSAANQGANLVGVEDAAGVFTADKLEGVLTELYTLAQESTGETYTAGAGGVAKGDLVEFTAAGVVSALPILTGNRSPGIAVEAAAAGQPVKVLRWDEKLEGVLTGATPGTAYYWDGSAYVTAVPSTADAYVWRVGIAATATDLAVGVEFIKRNAPA